MSVSNINIEIHKLSLTGVTIGRSVSYSIFCKARGRIALPVGWALVESRRVQERN